MNYTPNYHLPTWAMTDRIQMEDFNDMTAQLETTLTAEAAARQSGDDTLTAAVAKCGNCSVGMFTYTGTGRYGESSPTRITFPRMPLVFFVAGPTGLLAGAGKQTWGCILSDVDGHPYVSSRDITWSGTTCRFYHYADADQQLNAKETYMVIAFYAER